VTANTSKETEKHTTRAQKFQCLGLISGGASGSREVTEPEGTECTIYAPYLVIRDDLVSSKKKGEGTCYNLCFQRQKAFKNATSGLAILLSVEHLPSMHKTLDSIASTLVEGREGGREGRREGGREGGRKNFRSIHCTPESCQARGQVQG
jgi:hypothetical protein